MSGARPARCPPPWPEKILSQSILLSLVCPFVHVESDFPFDLQHVAGRMDRKHGVKSIQIDLTKATLVNVPSNQDGAVPTCRRTQKDTRTRKVTITGFKV
jgi:hypothetical protein